MHIPPSYAERQNRESEKPIITMTNETKQRIEKDADEFILKMQGDRFLKQGFKKLYIAGATAEHTRAWNEAIEEVLARQFTIEGPHGSLKVIRVDEVESLKR
jgi:hypothetical protein